MAASLPELNHLLAVAVEAARAAGDHAKRHRDRRKEVDRQFEHDVKLRLDVECQAEIERVILAAFPSHAILGEEGTRGGDQDTTWVVDPIDGTVNFHHGLPTWCSSVAFQQGGEVVVGVVYIPMLQQCFTATAEHAPECNGKPIHVSDTEKLSEALVLTGISKHVRDTRSFERFRVIAQEVQKIRVMGAAAVDMCQVACGHADAYFESGIHPWDWAAAGLIVRRAGGRVDATDPDSPVRAGFLCTNGRIHDDMRTLLAVEPHSGSNSCE